MNVDYRVFIKSLIGYVLCVLTTLLPKHALAILNSPANSTIYYDADEINLDKNTGDLNAEGNAFLLLGNVFVSAHKVQYNKQLNVLIAEGGVRIVRRR